MSCTFVLGGARSGKSRYAESLARGEKVYLATSEPFDDEMRARIAAHRAQRGAGWTTVEAPIRLAEAIREQDAKGRFILVDCLTVWLGNLMHHGIETGPAIDELLAAIGNAAAEVVLVSNEVGQGIVPENAMARAFRDLQGLCNQRVAASADEVVFVVAGIPMPIKKPRRPQRRARKARSAPRRRA